MTDDVDARISALIAEYLAPPPTVTVTEWAEANRILSGKDSSEPGPYRVLRTPYAREPQDALSASSRVQEVVLQWGAQTGKSTILNNWIGYLIDTQPGPTMIVQPTVELAKNYSRQRIVPMINESPKLAARVAENKSRDDANTMLLKEYPGGYLVITGANSAAGLRSRPIRDLAMDEIDAYPLDVDGEGDPIALAEARQSTFSRRKRLKTSTPTRKGFSRVELAYESSDRRRFFVPCPHCGEKQALEWGADKEFGLKWHHDEAGDVDPETAHYVCKHCAAVIEESAKPWMFHRGEWVAENPGARVRGYHLSSLYSPLGWFSWREVVEEWVKAKDAADKGDDTLLRAFINTRLALTYEEDMDRITAHALAERLEPYPLGFVPRAGLLITQGVDVQRDRLERRVWAYGRGEESWLVEVEVILGDPMVPEGDAGSPWTVLTERIRTLIAHESGQRVRIEATAVDSGDGGTTQAVYRYVRAHAHERVIAIKGVSGEKKAVLGKPTKVDVTWHGVTVPKGLQLWPVGVDEVKTLLYGRLRLKRREGPGVVHLPEAIRETGELDQLTAESMVVKYVKGKPRVEWHKPRHARNEALDCGVYAYAAAHFINLPRLRDADWERRAMKLDPDRPAHGEAPQATPAPADPAAVAAPAASPPAPARPAAPVGPRPRFPDHRGGFGRDW